MPSSAIRRLDIAAEQTYMSRDSSGEPSDDNLDWEAVELADATAIVAVGDTTTVAVNTATGGFGTNPGEAVVDPATEAPVKSGTMTIDFYLRGGLTSTNSGARGLRLLFSSRMAYSSTNVTTNSSCAVAASGTLTAANTPAIGDLIPYTLPGGRVTYGAAPAASTTVAAKPTMEVDDAYTAKSIERKSDGTGKAASWTIPAAGGDPVTYGTGTVALRVTGDGWQQLIFGASLTALTITAEQDGRGIRCSCTVDCPCVIDVAYDEITEPNWPEAVGSPILHSLGSPFRIYIPGSGQSSPQNMDGAWCVSAWTLSLTWTTAGAACGTYWTGRAPLEATSLDASLQMTIGHPSIQSREELAAAWATRQLIQLLLPFGGVVSTTAGKSYGGAIFIPAAYITDGTVTNPDLGSDAIQTTVTFGLSRSSAFNYILKLGLF